MDQVVTITTTRALPPELDLPPTPTQIIHRPGTPEDDVCRTGRSRRRIGADLALLVEARDEERQQAAPRAAVILLSDAAMKTLGVSMEGCTIQGDFAERGVFERVRRALLLPEEFAVRALFLRTPFVYTWEVLVESALLPPVPCGEEPPALTPTYAVEFYAEDGAGGAPLRRRTCLRELRLSGNRWAWEVPAPPLLGVEGMVRDGT